MASKYMREKFNILSCRGEYQLRLHFIVVGIIFEKIKKQAKPVMVEVEVQEFSAILCLPRSKFKASLCYVRPCLKIK